MIIGTPKEIKNNENRIPMTPATKDYSFELPEFQL